MEQKVKRSVVPIYLFGAAWLLYGAMFPLTGPLEIALCAMLSLAAWGVGRALFPDKSYSVPAGEEARQEKAREEKQQTQAPKAKLSPELAKLVEDRDRALGEMRRLNAAIRDEKISRQIDHLEDVTRKIIDQVVEDPKKQPQIRQFMNYYLPTTLKILNAYDRMSAAGIEGENITATREKIEGMMDTIVKAYDKQLDALYGKEAMDVSTDITVMEQLLRREGLNGASGSQ